MTEQPRGTIDNWTHDYWTQQRWTTFAPLALRAAAALIRSSGLAVGWYTLEDGRLDALTAIHEVAESAEPAGGPDQLTKMVGLVVGHPGLALEPMDLLWQYLSTTEKGRPETYPDDGNVVSLWSDSVGTTEGVVAVLEAAADHGDAYLLPGERPSTAVGGERRGSRRRRSRSEAGSAG
jgi:hypothetical protein